MPYGALELTPYAPAGGGRSRRAAARRPAQEPAAGGGGAAAAGSGWRWDLRGRRGCSGLGSWRHPRPVRRPPAEQVAHHRVAEQPPAKGEHQPVPGPLQQPRLDEPVHPGGARRRRAPRAASPSRSRSSSSTRSTRRVSASSTSWSCIGAEAGGQPVGVRRRVLDVPPPHAADVRVGARADAPPVAAGPVEQVVPAAAGLVARPVGDLVPLEAGRGRAARRPARYLSARSSWSGRRQLAAAHPPGQRGALLHDQGVRRDVVGRAGEGRVERALPVRDRLPRRAVDEVEADLLEAGRPRPCRPRRAPGPGRGSGPAPAGRGPPRTACRTRSG